MLKSQRIRVFIFSILLAGAGISLQAQQRYSMTTQEAMDYALKHVVELKNLKIDREIQDAKNREITGQALPQINGSVTTSRFFEIPVTLLPDFVTPQVYGVLEKEGVQNGTGNPVVSPNEPDSIFSRTIWCALAGIGWLLLSTTIVSTRRICWIAGKVNCFKICRP